MSLILALLAQVGPAPSLPPVSPLPPEILERREQQRAPAEAAAPERPTLSQELVECLDFVSTAPLDALDAAESWLAEAKGAERGEAGHCLGLAFTRLERWSEAQDAFLAARDAVEETDLEYRARLGAMAGNAALAAGDPQTALAVLDAAEADAQAIGPAAQIAADRARALVMLGRESEAEAALSAARQASPQDPQLWLLSATLSRRLGKLAEAQEQIERAAELLPIDPAIGLEAGVIAMLSGREESARRSWQSVIDAAPESDAAATARSYLAQLDPPGAGSR